LLRFLGNGVSMHFPRSYLWSVVAALSWLSVACLEQFDPSRNNALFHKEQTQAALTQPKLTSAGELPPAGGPAINIDEKFAQLCSGCHGPNGQGDGPAGVALTPKPRNFTDAAWQG